MSSKGLDDVIRKAIDLNVRYYSSLGRLTTDYLRELAANMVEPMKAAVDSAQPAAAGTNTSTTSNTSREPVAMVLEAESGSVAVGVFLVENHLATEVDSAVSASFFKDPDGFAIQPQFTFDPDRIVLKPREQILVRVFTTMGADLEPDTRYSGEFAVPGLKGTAIPVVLRSRRRQ